MWKKVFSILKIIVAMISSRGWDTEPEAPAGCDPQIFGSAAEVGTDLFPGGTIILMEKIEADFTVDQFQIYSDGLATIKVNQYRTQDNGFIRTDTVTLNLAAGVNTFDDTDIPHSYLADRYLGFYVGAGVFNYDSVAESETPFLTVLGDNVAITNPSAVLDNELKFTLTTK